MKSDLPVRTLADLMAHAIAMELEAAQRYLDLADAMETANNREVAALFRTLAQQEREHARRIMSEAVTSRPSDEPFEAPGTVPVDEVHYLMQPWHALRLALAAEQRAERFFGELAEVAPDEDVRAAARALQGDEATHVRLIEQWLAKVPAPDADWASDPDPPRYVD